MKKILLLIIMVAVAVTAAATDRFYIEDFEIAPGETLTVSILLDNEVSYTAFQTDICLPEGLTVEQEDGDYIFDLTNRKSRDHIITSQLQPNGTIRVISYSNKINPYSGNSGALVTFNVIAGSDFTGPAVITMCNTLFTTTGGVEVAFGDEVCHVSAPSTGRRGDVNGDSVVDIDDVTALISLVLGNSVPGIIIENANVNGEGSIDIDDVTVLINMVLTGQS